MSSSVKIIVGVVTAVIITGILLIFFMGTFMENLGMVKPDSYQPEDGIYRDSQAVKDLNDRRLPEIKAENIIISVGQTVHVMDFIKSATDADGNDLISQISVEGDGLKSNNTFCSDVSGKYFIIYSVTDRLGLKSQKAIMILVNNQKGGSAS